MENSWLGAAERRNHRRLRVRTRRDVRHEISGGGVGLRRKARRPVSVREKYRELQTLIPGGKGLHADQLFLRTADYIFHLRLQLHALQALSKFYMP